MQRARILAAEILLALALAPACAQSAGKTLLRAEFWADLKPVAGVGDEWPVSEETARKRMLEEAAWVYSGMIWGFDFEYTPSDKTRAVAERFVLKPLGAIAPEALAFAPGAQRRYDDETRSFVEYLPDAASLELMSDYGHDPWKGAQGVGKADLQLGIKGRRAAYEDALRLAVRGYLQSIEANKPRLVRGRVAFERPPTLALVDGFYTSQARARVMVLEILRYKLY
jgi:hypothetical protein